MSAINIDGDDKDWFDDWKSDDQTHSEAFSEMVDIVRAFEGEPVDVEGLADELEASLLPKLESHGYRGAREAIEEHLVKVDG